MSDLPQLPEPTGDIRLPGAFGLATDGYTADQMREYATASLASAQQRIEELKVQVRQADERGDEAMRRAHAAEARAEELERALGELVAVIGNRHYGRMPDVVQHAYDAARALVTPTRPSKGFLKGESPQATWPFAQDDKGTK